MDTERLQHGSSSMAAAAAAAAVDKCVAAKSTRVWNMKKRGPCTHRQNRAHKAAGSSVPGQHTRARPGDAPQATGKTGACARQRAFVCAGCRVQHMANSTARCLPCYLSACDHPGDMPPTSHTSHDPCLVSLVSQCLSVSVSLSLYTHSLSLRLSTRPPILSF